MLLKANHLNHSKIYRQHNSHKINAAKFPIYISNIGCDQTIQNHEVKCSFTTDRILNLIWKKRNLDSTEENLDSTEKKWLFNNFGSRQCSNACKTPSDKKSLGLEANRLFYHPFYFIDIVFDQEQWKYFCNEEKEKPYIWLIW